MHASQLGNAQGVCSKYNPACVGVSSVSHSEVKTRKWAATPPPYHRGSNL